MRYDASIKGLRSIILEFRASWCSRSRVHKYRLPGLLFSAGSADTITDFHYFGAAAVGVGPWAKTQPFVLAWRIWAVIIGNV